MLPISDTTLAYPAEVADPLLATPCATAAPLPWSPLQRVAFRIAFLYFFCFVFLFGNGTIFSRALPFFPDTAERSTTL
jgi:hypothetical protein